MEMIDKRIIESYVNGFTSLSIIEDIATRVANMSRVIKDEGFDVDDFIDLEDLSEESKSQLEQRFKHSSISKRIWVLYKNQEVCGLLDYGRAIAIDSTGNQTVIKEDSNMPYEMYDGPDLDV